MSLNDTTQMKLKYCMLHISRTIVQLGYLCRNIHNIKLYETLPILVHYMQYFQVV